MEDVTINNIKITSKMKKAAKRVYVQHHARNNAITSIKFEVFLQKYGRYPETVEIWNFDEDIKKVAEQIEQMLFDEYLSK